MSSELFDKCSIYIMNRMLNPLRPQFLEEENCMMDDIAFDYLRNNKAEIIDFAYDSLKKIGYVERP